MKGLKRVKEQECEICDKKPVKSKSKSKSRSPMSTSHKASTLYVRQYAWKAKKNLPKDPQQGRSARLFAYKREARVQL